MSTYNPCSLPMSLPMDVVDVVDEFETEEMPCSNQNEEFCEFLGGSEVLGLPEEPLPRVGEMMSDSESDGLIMKSKKQKKAKKDKKMKKEKKDKKEKKTRKRCRSESDDIPVKRPKPQKRKKTYPNKPRGALSGYFIFANEKRPVIRAEDPKMKITEIAKRIGVLWGTLSESEKAPYQAQADADKKRYNDEMEEWKLTPEYAEFEAEKAAGRKANPSKRSPTKRAGSPKKEDAHFMCDEQSGLFAEDFDEGAVDLASKYPGMVLTEDGLQVEQNAVLEDDTFVVLMSCLRPPEVLFLMESLGLEPTEPQRQKLSINMFDERPQLQTSVVLGKLVKACLMTKASIHIVPASNGLYNF